MTDENKAPEAPAPESTKGSELSRREFVTGVGGLGAGFVLGGLLVKGLLLPDEVIAIPASQGYLLVDKTECAGCTSCMAACSLVHEGSVNLSLSRIQILRNPLIGFPNDITTQQCHQCVYPACVEACPTGAMHVDAANGNVRTVDEGKCIGCERCVNACPFTPSRAIWNGADKHAQKCDLCADTPFWNEKGGVGGKQACAAVCPAGAIKFTREIPSQNGKGYDIDMYPTLPNVRGWGTVTA